MLSLVKATHCLPLAVCAFALMTAACSQEYGSGTPPTPLSISIPDGRTFTVLNGWTRDPVAGATVRVNNTEAMTDSRGQIRFPVDSAACTVAEVIAAGFLERRTCAAAEITLWPVADEAEREATRALAFRNDRLKSSEWIIVKLQPEFGPGDIAAWAAAANDLQRISQSFFTFSFSTTLPNTGVIVRAGPAAKCVYSWWPIHVAGFCIAGNGWDDELLVQPESQGDFSVAQRALLYLALPLHTMPGLINKSTPDPALSAFERKTLHMMGLRKGLGASWPDVDR